MISATLGSGLRRLASTLALAALVAFAPAALAQTSDYNAILSGSNEVPAVESGATGRVDLQLNGTTLVVTGSFRNLESAYNTDIGAHLHIGGPTENGPVDIVLNPTLGAQQRSGQFQAASNTFELTQEQIDRLDAGGYYVNVHSVDNPTGEVRGQVLPLANVIPIADARAMGTGMEVTIEGTVSRALGQFAYLQDETAGITIRQPSGDLFDDIADGDIGPGTVVRITGTTSEFRQLFQINDGDLTAYEVRGQSTAPQPQVVTLSDLIATGEDFEGELVRVTGATIDGGVGGTFAAGTNYSADDGTGALTLRVGNADNTNRDDTGIPTGPITVTSVVTQFDFSDPAVGYQLLPIQVGDLSAPTQVIHNSPDPAASVVDIYINAGADDAPALADVPFRRATGFLNLPAGVDLTISIAPGDSESVDEFVFQNTYVLNGGNTQLIATGVLSDDLPANPESISTDFTLLVAANAQVASADPMQVDFNVVHGSPNAPSVDVNARGVGTLFPNAPYTGITGYTGVAPDTYIIDITAAGSPDAVFSAVAPLADAAGGALTVLASGFLGENPGLPGFGLLAVFPDGASTLLPAATANVQVIHNSPDPAAATVDIYINGQEGDDPTLPGVPFRGATGFLPLPAGEEIIVTVVPEGGAIADGAAFPFTLDPLVNYQLIATGVLSDGLPANPEEISTDFVLLARDGALIQTSSMNEVGVSVVHGSPDAPTVDALVRGAGIALADDAPYQGITPYTIVPPGEYIVDITLADGTTNVAAFTADLTGAGGRGVTVLASGYLSPTGDLPAFGLLAVFPNGDSDLLPAAPLPAQALVQVIHNSPDPAAATVDIFINGQDGDDPTIPDLAFRTATEFVPVPAGEEITVTVVPDGANFADGASFPFTLDDGVNYQLIATGVLSDGLPANPENISTAFTLLPRADALPAADADDEVAISVVHGSPNAPTVDALVRGTTIALADDAPYQGITGYTVVPEGVYVVDITLADGVSLVAAYDVDVSEAGGSAITVLASGYLNPPTSDLPAFELLAVFGDGSEALLPLSVSNEDGTGTLPEVFALRGNYPNPFAATTRIGFDLPSDAEVRVSVYDVLGRTVAEIAPTRLAAGSGQTVDLDASRLAAGAYVYRVEAQMGAETRVETGRMTVVR
ncbi:MAG: DUF4397 domain-containing protein [Bacteroidota bacterium]